MSDYLPISIDHLLAPADGAALTVFRSVPQGLMP